MFRCGPAPVAAIKEGNIFYGYDSKFIFAEVNADRVTWMVDPTGDMMAVTCSKQSVGKCISTKAVGLADREDITNTYKYPEGMSTKSGFFHLLVAIPVCLLGAMRTQCSHVVSDPGEKCHSTDNI